GQEPHRNEAGPRRKAKSSATPGGRPVEARKARHEARGGTIDCGQTYAGKTARARTRRKGHRRKAAGIRRGTEKAGRGDREPRAGAIDRESRPRTEPSRASAAGAEARGGEFRIRRDRFGP